MARKEEEYVNITHRFPRKTEDRDGWAEGRRALALNMGLALSSGKEFKFIKVNQRDYPLHLMGPCVNWFLLFFRNKEINVHPGNINGSSRPDYIGVKYRFLRAWAPIPIFRESTPPFSGCKEGRKYEAYKVLDSIINGNPYEVFYGKTELDLARQIAGTKKILC